MRDLRSKELRDNDVKKINFFVRILPCDSLYIIETVELIILKCYTVKE